MESFAMPRTLIVAIAAAAASLAFAQDADRPATEKVPSAERLLQVPLGGYVIGQRSQSAIKNPYEGDKKAISDGRGLFDTMNCSGCHAPLGGGGMGPPLSDDEWIYGGAPGQIYLTIAQGRPNGMPSFQLLSSEAIWKIVAYVRTLSDSPR